MLTWRRANNVWLGNGFKIERHSDCSWTLEEADSAVAVGVTVAEPLAELPSLSACKYKAEQLHHADRTAVLRRRLKTVFFASGLVALVMASQPIVMIAALVISGASALELLMTGVDGRVGGARQIVQ
jgi:DICT domain-containing protein